MKHLNHCKTINRGTYLLFVNEKIKMADIKDACPIFFSNRVAGEKLVLHRGCVIVDRPSERSEFRFRIYAHDVRREQMVCLNDHTDKINDIVDAKTYIDEAIKNCDDPLSMSFEVVQMVVPVMISMATFRDLNGNLTHCEIDQVVQIGSDPERRIDPKNYLGAIKQVIENEACAMVPRNAPLVPVVQSLDV